MKYEYHRYGSYLFQYCIYISQHLNIKREIFFTSQEQISAFLWGDTPIENAWSRIWKVENNVENNTEQKELWKIIFPS